MKLKRTESVHNERDLMKKLNRFKNLKMNKNYEFGENHAN